MPAYSHIACCIDTGESSKATLVETVETWKASGTQVSAVFVAPPVEVMRGGLTEWEVDSDDPLAPPRRWLERFAAEQGVRPVMLVGDPPHEVVLDWLTESSGCDLVVANAHNTGVVRALLGSFATELAYRAPMDTLIVPPDSSGEPRRIARILCAVSVDEDPGRALRAASRVSRAAGAAVTLVHVVVPPVPAMRNLIAEKLPMPEGRQREADELLADLRARMPGADSVVLAGDPIDAISDHAEQTDADLIVVGPRSGGRPGLGGFASKLIRNAPCPVLLARDG